MVFVIKWSFASEIQLPYFYLIIHLILGFLKMQLENWFWRQLASVVSQEWKHLILETFIEFVP